MNFQKANGTKKKDRTNNAISVKHNTISVKLERPLLTGLMLMIGMGLGGAILQLMTMVVSVLFMMIQRYLGG